MNNWEKDIYKDICNRIKKEKYMEEMLKRIELRYNKNNLKTK